MFENTVLDGLMLDKNGVVESTLSQAWFNVCPECCASLKCNKVPQLALANNLYRDVLPDQFQDLTWVEEMVCAIYYDYRNTVHITRLYGSSDPTQPTVLHGNRMSWWSCQIPFLEGWAIHLKLTPQRSPGASSAVSESFPLTGRLSINVLMSVVEQPERECSRS